MPRSTVTTDITTLPRYQLKTDNTMINPELEREKSRKAFGKESFINREIAGTGTTIRESSSNSNNSSGDSVSSRNSNIRANSITGGTYSGNKAPPPLPDRPQSLRITKEENKEKLKSLKKQLKLRKKLQKYNDNS